MKYPKPGKNNKEERMNFVEHWADYVRTHSDKEWSRQQNILINSLMQNAKNSKLYSRANIIEQLLPVRNK